MATKANAARSVLMSALAAGFILAGIGVSAATPSPVSSNGSCSQPSTSTAKPKPTRVAQCCRRVGKSYQCGRC